MVEGHPSEVETGGRPAEAPRRGGFDPRDPRLHAARGPFRLAAFALSAVALVLLGVLAVGFLIPGSWEAERETRIEAGAEEIFPFFTSASGWAQWTPMPETGVETLRGPGDEEVGWSWDDPRYGQGVFTLVEVNPPRTLRYHVNVEDGSLRTEGVLVLEESDGATRVVWREDGDFGRNPLLGYLALRMANAQGEQMEQSLDRLRGRVEGGGHE